jgi:hypothetical protein
MNKKPPKNLKPIKTESNKHKIFKSIIQDDSNKIKFHIPELSMWVLVNEEADTDAIREKYLNRHTL